MKEGLEIFQQTKKEKTRLKNHFNGRLNKKLTIPSIKTSLPTTHDLRAEDHLKGAPVMHFLNIEDTRSWVQVLEGNTKKHHDFSTKIFQRSKPVKAWFFFDGLLKDSRKNYWIRILAAKFWGVFFVHCWMFSSIYSLFCLGCVFVFFLFVKTCFNVNQCFIV